MALETGLFSIYNVDTPLRYAVDVTSNYASIAVFEVQPEGTDIFEKSAIQVDTWENALDFISKKPNDIQEGYDLNSSGRLDLRANGIFIPDFPGATNGAIYRGRSCIFSDGMTGLDDINRRVVCKFIKTMRVFLQFGETDLHRLRMRKSLHLSVGGLFQIGLMH